MLSLCLLSSTNCGRSRGFNIFDICSGFLRQDLVDSEVVREMLSQGYGAVAVYILIGLDGVGTCQYDDARMVIR
jgi:hypothetical protein